MPKRKKRVRKQEKKSEYKIQCKNKKKVSHLSGLASDFKKGLNIPELNDVQIFVGNEKKLFYASSFVLAARSPVFKAMLFREGFKEQKTKEITLPTIHPTVFASFLEYLTTGETELNEKTIFDIIELSDQYGIEDLYVEGKEYLKKYIDIENCLSILESNSSFYEHHNINLYCWELIDKETEIFLNNSNNLSISSKTIDSLLPRNGLTIKEIDLFNFLIKWGKNQEQNQKNSSFKDLIKPHLQHIRFPLMDFKELIQEVRPLGVIDDLQYIEALEFNIKKNFNMEDIYKKNLIQFQEREGLPNDFFLPGPEYSLSNSDRILTKINQDGNTTGVNRLLINKGIHKWSLKILKTKNSYFMIGISPRNINQSNIINHRECGWYISCEDGTLRSGPPFNYRGKTYYDSKILEGTVIDVELDISKSTIKYFINGVDKGIAYEGILLDQPLRLAIEIHSEGDSVQLLNYYKIE